MHSALRKYVRAVLVEVMKTTQDAAGSNLALMRVTDGQGKNTYVLYVPSAVEQMLVSGDIKHENISRAIVGFMYVQPHQGEAWNAGEVKLSAAQKGYGPLMYQYAMSDFAGGLFPDRGSTSQKARVVWQRYNQDSSVEKKPFDDPKNPKTPEPIDDMVAARGTTYDGDEAYLNQAYDAPGDASGRSSLMAAHQQFLTAMAAKKFTKNVVESMIENIGDEYFSMRYRE